ncbi:MAG TPA: hypothetical protein VKU19_30330 [Bryobacteraceae bacterium]|nr:hypothetical protein [Bryobacteraceae bacterium]
MEAPIIAEEPYACLEMLCRKVADGPEVRAIVAAIRAGAVETMRDPGFIAEGGALGELSGKVSAGGEVSPALASWAVRSWYAALRK